MAVTEIDHGDKQVLSTTSDPVCSADSKLPIRPVVRYAFLRRANAVSVSSHGTGSRYFPKAALAVTKLVGSSTLKRIEQKETKRNEEEKERKCSPRMAPQYHGCGKVT